jgi:hypothetical protein
MDSPKYNRTFHVPWSPGGTNDDKKALSVDTLLGVPIVITEKVDGSNTSIENSGCYARTHAGPPTHESFDALKALTSNIKHKLPVGLQIFGEWCYALHSIPYDKLPGYFLAFNVHSIGFDTWESWEEVEMWAQDIGVHTVPVLFKGVVQTSKELQVLTENLSSQPSGLGTIREGVVIRRAEAFEGKEFSNSVMKWVRANHVQTSDHWKDQEIVKNKLKL